MLRISLGMLGMLVGGGVYGQMTYVTEGDGSGNVIYELAGKVYRYEIFGQPYNINARTCFIVPLNGKRLLSLSVSGAPQFLSPLTLTPMDYRVGVNVYKSGKWAWGASLKPGESVNVNGDVVSHVGREICVDTSFPNVKTWAPDGFFVDASYVPKLQAYATFYFHCDSAPGSGHPSGGDNWNCDNPDFEARFGRTYKVGRVGNSGVTAEWNPKFLSLNNINDVAESTFNVTKTTGGAIYGELRLSSSGGMCKYIEVSDANGSNTYGTSDKIINVGAIGASHGFRFRQVPIGTPMSGDCNINGIFTLN